MEGEVVNVPYSLLGTYNPSLFLFTSVMPGNFSTSSSQNRVEQVLKRYLNDH